MSNLEVVVDGRWLSLDCWYGDVEPSWCWPGGSDTLTFSLGSQPAVRFTGGETADVYSAGVCIWAGSLSEPDPSADQMSAVGAWKDAYNFDAVDASDVPTHTLGVAINNASPRGMSFTRGGFGFALTGADVDLSQGPLNVGDLADAWSLQAGLQWGVDPYRRFYALPPATVPSWQTLPLDQGFGYDLTNYASTLNGVYFDGTTYQKLRVTDPNAVAAHGYKETPVDLTGRGTLTTAKARTILTNLLAYGKATPAWTQPIGFSYGDILTAGDNGNMVPVDLDTVGTDIGAALLRVHGGQSLAQRRNGQMYVDIPLGRVALAGGLLTTQPAQIATKTLADFVAKTPANRLTA